MFDRLRWIPRFSVKHPFAVLGIALLLTFVGLSQAAKLKVDANIATLLPETYDSVRALDRLQKAVGSESTVDVAVYSPSFAQNVRFAEAFEARMMAMQAPDGDAYFTRSELRRDVRFVTDNALYFATFDELDRLDRFLLDQAAEVRASSDPLRVNLFPGTDQDEVEREAEAEQLRSDLAQLDISEYVISPDSTTLVVKFYPTGAQTDIGYVERLYQDIDSLVVAVAPGTFHPEMRVTPAGRLLRQTIEVKSITNDVANSFGAGVLAVLLTVVLYFLYKSVQARTGGRFVLRVVLEELLRTPVTALLLTLPLMMSLSWAGGVAALRFGTLNLLTSTLGLVLFGLGIDYGIHFYARYAEERGRGKSVASAAEETFVSTGQSIAVSALTTASALFVLQIADFRGFSEFGFIGGVGILFALVSMLTVLPALLSIAERTGALNLRMRGEHSEVEIEKRFPFARTILLACAGVTVLSLSLAPRVSFQYDFSKLEPEYDDYDRRADALKPVQGTSDRRNPAYILLDSASQVRTVSKVLKDLAASDTLVLAVESLQERFPTDPGTEQRKLQRLADIRTTLNDPYLSADTTGQIERLRRAASATEPVPLDSVPAFLTRPFMTRDGEIGDFVIVFPRGNMADGRNSLRFAELIGQVTTPAGESFYAASTQLVAADMLKLMRDESPLMIGVTFLLVFILVLVSFRSFRWTFIAMTPLVFGLVWMMGTMALGGILLTFYNLVVLPTVLGIGNDGGVHLAHRYQEEGKGSIRRVLRSTGEHVTMGAMTNLIGFSGLLISSHPGLRSIGVLAVTGIGTTLATTLVFFPALIQVLEDNDLLSRKERPPRRTYDLGDRLRLRNPTFRLHAPDADNIGNSDARNMDQESPSTPR